MAKATGVRPADMERVTLVFGAAGPGPGGSSRHFLVMVRTTPPADLKAVRDALGEMVGNFEPRDHRGRRYYTAKWGDIPVGLFKAGDHELVLGTPAAVEAAIDRQAAGPPTRPPLPGWTKRPAGTRSWSAPGPRSSP